MSYSIISGLRSKINEAVSILLMEDKATDNRSKGRKLAKSYVKFDRPGGEQESEIWSKLPVVRKDDYSLAPYLYPLYFRDKPNDEECKKINSFLLNKGISVDELNGKYQSLKQLLDLVNNGLENKDDSKIDTKSNDSEYKYNGYKIVRINNFNDAKKYAHYVDWCVTQSPNHFKQYTRGNKLFYFLFEEGFEKISKEDYEYEQSMFAVLVNEYGSIYDIVSRHNEEGYLDESELFEIIGGKAKSVLLGLTKEEIENKRKGVKERILNYLKQGNNEGIESEEGVDYVKDCHSLTIIKLDRNNFMFYSKKDKCYIEWLEGYKCNTIPNSNSLFIKLFKDNKYNLFDTNSLTFLFESDMGYIKELVCNYYLVEENDNYIYLYDVSKGRILKDYGITDAYRLYNNHIIIETREEGKLIFSIKDVKVVYILGDNKVYETEMYSIIGVGDLLYFDLSNNREINLSGRINGYEIDFVEREFSIFRNDRVMCLCKTTDGVRIYVDNNAKQVGRAFKQIISQEGNSGNPLVQYGNERFHLLDKE